MRLNRALWMWYFCWHQQVFINYRKDASCGIIQSHLMPCRHIFKKRDRKCSEYFGIGLNSFLCWLDYFWVSYRNQKKYNSFWKIIKKICLHRQKMNVNDAIFFLMFWKNYSIAFKWVVMDSESINGSVDTDETVTGQILNRNQWRYHRKVLM